MSIHKLYELPLTTKVRKGELFHSAGKFIVCDFTFIVRAVSNPATVAKWNYDGAGGEIRDQNQKIRKPSVIFLSEGFAVVKFRQEGRTSRGI